MKRAILLLATALLGTSGCTSHPCDRTSIAVQWLFIDAAGGQHGCSDSGTAVVHVFLDGTPQFDQTGNTNFTCGTFENGVILTDFRGGQHALQIDALDQNGTLLYQDQRTFTANSCGASPNLPVDVVAVQGPLDLAYTLPVPQCPPGSFVWFSLTGLSPGTATFVVDGLHTPEAFPCGNPYPLPIDAPFGQYRLDFIQVVQPGTTTFNSVYENCTAQAVNHLGSDQVPVALSASTTGCQ
jgi:hypothetical protein